MVLLLVQIGQEPHIHSACLPFLSLQAYSIALVTPVHLVDRAVWIIAIDVLQEVARHEVERDGILIAVHIVPGTFLIEVDDGAIVEDAHICISGGLYRNDRVVLEVVLDEGLGLGGKLLGGKRWVAGEAGGERHEAESCHCKKLVDD